jgi:Predicted choline kinase involved in LPS biosynthesis
LEQRERYHPGLDRDLAMVSLAHPATVTELAVLYAALARSRETSDPIAPTVIFTGLAPGLPDQGIRVRLNGFGITTLTDVELGLVDHEVAALSHASTAEGGRPDRVAYLLGGSLHGWCLRARHHDTDHTHDADAANDVDDVELVSTVASLLERERLRTFAARAGCPDDPVFTRTHTPGSDSRGVVQFGVGTDSGTRQVVAKIGPRDVITGEVRFNSGVNALLVRKGRPPLFPEVYGVLVEGDQAVSLMEAGEPVPLAPLFADPAKTILGEHALGSLAAHLDQLAAWYRLTAEPRVPTVADYLYRERFHVLRELPVFVATFAGFFGDCELADLLDAPVRLPGGLVIPGYTQACRWLDEVVPSLLPTHGSAVHGDIYASNMLRRPDGTPMLIDPRTVWEGRDRPDVGYGDPVFDLATLLHGAFPMAAILDAVRREATSDLFGGELPGEVATGPELDASTLTLPVRLPPTVRSLELRLLAIPPGDPTAPQTQTQRQTQRQVRTRLYLGAASSLLGWLKYSRSLRTREAWLATYVYTLWYVWQAKATWENRDDQGGNSR